MQFLPSRSERAMVVALFVPSCDVVFDAGWKKAWERRRARLNYPSRRATYSRVNKAEFSSTPKFYFRCLKVNCADCEGLEIARWLHGNALLKYRNYTTNF